MAFTLNPETGKIEFGVVADSTHDAISRDIASEFGVSETFNDDFNIGDPDFTDSFVNDNWTEDGSGDFTISGGVMNWETDNTEDNHFSFRDILGQTVNNTKWTLRFKLDVENFAQGGDATNQELYISLADTTNTATESTQDAIGLRFVTDNTLSEIRMLHADGQDLQAPTTLMTTNISATIWFVEIKRTSATGMTVNLFSDEDYTQLIETASTTISASITDLRYLRIQNRDGLDGTNDHTFDGTMDDVQFWNGSTTLTDWNSVGTNVVVNTSNQVMGFTTVGGGGDQGSFVDLTSVSDTNWVLRFKVNFSTLTLGAPSANFYVGMSDNNVTMAGVGTQDMISFHAHYHNTTQKFGAFDTDGAVVPKGDGDEIDLSTTPVTGTDYYVELRRTSSTTYDITLFSDRDYSVVIATDSGTCSANTIGLQYLKVAEFSGGTAVMTGIVDDIQFWNGITVPVITSSKWRMRFTLDITNLVESVGSDVSMWIGMSDEDETFGSNDAQDGFFLTTFVDNAVNFFRVQTSDNSAPRSSGSDGEFATKPTVSTFFFEMERDSMSQTTARLYTDNTYTSVSESITQAGISGTDNLKYLKLFNDEVPTNVNEINGTFDDFTFTDMTVEGQTDKTFTVDAQLVLSFVTIDEEFLVDAILVVIQEETFLVDVLIQAQGGLCGISLANLKAYWTFDETSGVLVNQATSIGSVDSLGTSADGTVGGSIDRSQTGQVSDSYEFEGLTETQAGNRIAIGSSTSQFNFMHTPNSEGTFNFWINPRDNSQTFADLFVNENNGSGNTGMFIGIALGKIQVRPRAPVTELLSPVVTDNALTPNVFNMVTVVWDETIGADIYFNGVFEKSLLRTGGSASSGNANHPLTIGARTDTQASVTFDGFLDESTAWDRKLTANEITILYNLNNSGSPIQEGNQAVCALVDALVQSLGDNGSCTANYMDDMLLQSDWVTTDTGSPGFNRINETTEKWEWSPDPQSVNATMAQDMSTVGRLGSKLNDNGGWRARFTLDLTSYTNGNSNHQFFGVRDVSQIRNHGANTPDQKFIGFRITSSVSGTGPNIITLSRNGGTGTFVTGGNFGSEVLTVAGGVIGCQIERTSSTSATVGMYTDGTFTTLINEFTWTIDSGITDLQYFGGGNWNFSQSGEGQFGGLMDDLEIINIGAIGNVGCAQVDTKLIFKQDEEFFVDAFIQALDQEKTFLVDARLKAFNTDKEFFVDGIAFVPPAKLFIVQGLIKGTVDEEFFIDSCLRSEPFFNFTVDACIQQNNLSEDFRVDALAFDFPVRLFLIDSIVRYSQGTTTEGGIPDLIIRVLRENITLTGRQIVEEIVKITSDPAEGFSFRGKTSRIKNWLTRLTLDNLIQEDGSNLDWYKTNWSLV